MVDDATIDDFWKWFSSVCDSFGQAFENDRLIRELDERIAELGDYGWELGPGARDPDASMLAFSPGGDVACLRETRHIVGRVPTCPGWEFYPAKPPKRWRRQVIVETADGELLIDAAGWKYDLRQRSSGAFDLMIVAPELKHFRFSRMSVLIVNGPPEARKNSH